MLNEQTTGYDRKADVGNLQFVASKQTFNFDDDQDRNAAFAVFRDEAKNGRFTAENHHRFQLLQREGEPRLAASKEAELGIGSARLLRPKRSSIAGRALFPNS